MIDEDARDLGIHAEIERTIRRIMFANQCSRKQAVSHIDGFLENDPDSERFTLAPTRAKRARRHAEASA